MRPKTSRTGNFFSSGRFRIAAAAVAFLVGTACTDQPEATNPGAAPHPSAEPGADANERPPQELARIPSTISAEPTARAQDPDRRERRRARLREDRYADLGLSDEQKQSIEALRAEQRAWFDEHRDEIRALGNKRRAAWQAGDEGEADAIRLQVRELRETLPTERDILALLTDEQREELRKNRPFAPKRRPQRPQAPLDQASDPAPAPS